MTEEVKEKIEREEMTERGLAGQIMDAAWPDRGGNHWPAEFWENFGEGVEYALKCLMAWGLLDERDTRIPYPGDFPRMTRSEIIDALVTVAGYFNRPGEIGYEIADVASHGVVSYAHMSDRGVVVMRDGGLHFSFTTGLVPLDNLIASMLMRADQISALMMVCHAARPDDSAASPHEVEGALTRLKWRWGDVKPEPGITTLNEPAGEKMVLRLAERIWTKMGHYRHGGPFELAKGTPAYNDCIEMARETLL